MHHCAAKLAEQGTFNALISNGQWLFDTATSLQQRRIRCCRWISRRSPPTSTGSPFRPVNRCCSRRVR
ncbi:hypothetical protein KBZ15_16135 [Cyanobium sp. BA20m-p-22]|nr:hypothetical protein [Cyanobium sp. BA20m-p-22]